MSKPAARLGDMHTCPLTDGPKPHVGGPILPPCCPTVLIGGMPAARMGDQATCASAPDVIAQGSTSVLIGGQPAARLGDMTVHGGVITVGCPTVLIGGATGGGAGLGMGGLAGARAGIRGKTVTGKQGIKGPNSRDKLPFGKLSSGKRIAALLMLLKRASSALVRVLKSAYKGIANVGNKVWNWILHSPSLKENQRSAEFKANLSLKQFWGASTDKSNKDRSIGLFGSASYTQMAYESQRNVFDTKHVDLDAKFNTAVNRVSGEAGLGLDLNEQKAYVGAEAKYDLAKVEAGGEFALKIPFTKHHITLGLGGEASVGVGAEAKAEGGRRDDGGWGIKGKLKASAGIGLGLNFSLGFK